MISTSIAFLSRPAPAAASAIFCASIDGPGMRAAARGGVDARTGFLKIFVVAFFVTEIKPRRHREHCTYPALIAGKPVRSLPHLGPASRESSGSAAGRLGASALPFAGSASAPASALSAGQGVTVGGSYSGGG